MEEHITTILVLSSGKKEGMALLRHWTFYDNHGVIGNNMKICSCFSSNIYLIFVYILRFYFVTFLSSWFSVSLNSINYWVYMICTVWYFSQKKLFCKVAEWKQEYIDFCTCSIRFINFKTNGQLAKHPNYLNMAFN